MIPVFAFEPFTLAAVAIGLALTGMTGLMVVWWMVKSAVRMALKAVVLGVVTVGVMVAVGVGMIAMMSF